MKNLFTNKEGFACLSLMQANGTAVQNQQHNLVVYKICQKKQQDDAHAAPVSHYLQMLANNPKPATSKHTITVETNLCSTKLTQDVHLLGLLNYAADKRPIEVTLRALHEVRPEEMVKVLQDILDGLFDILNETRQKTVEILVFDGLLKLIEILHHKKYQNFLPVLDRYIGKSFSSTLAFIKLISILQTQIEEHLQAQNDCELFRRIRYLHYIFKFITRSQILHTTLDDHGKQRQSFDGNLQILLQLLVSVGETNNMMRSQSAILKILHEFVDDVMEVYCPLKLRYVVVKSSEFC